MLKSSDEGEENNLHHSTRYITMTKDLENFFTDDDDDDGHDDDSFAYCCLSLMQ